MKFIFNWIPAAESGPVALALAFVVVAGMAPRDGTAAPAGESEAPTVERAELVMGTIARVALPASAGRAEAFEAAFAALRAVDASMSLYRRDGALVRVNLHAASRPEHVDAALFALLGRARELAAETDGAFDVTILPLLRLWGAYPELSYLGGGSTTAVGIAGLRLDPRGRTVRFARSGMGLDLGGIAKGFALDRARVALAGAGVTRARLDLGGQLAFIGGGPDGGWRVAVRDPDDPERPLGILVLGPDASVSTSGNYERDFAREGWRAPSHIYDPRTGRPATGDFAVTVWATDAATADALSTTLFVLGLKGASRVLAREPDAGALFADRRSGGGHVTLVGRPPRGFVPASDRTATDTFGNPTAVQLTHATGDPAR